MTARPPTVAAAMLVASLTLTGCTGGDEPAVAPTADATAPALELPTDGDAAPLDPAEFTADIDHPYWPMKPRTRWTYREIEDDGTRLRIVVIATTQTRKIANGVTARVVRDVVFEDGEIIEDTKDWYAQDAHGNVWYLGEDTAEFEDGKLVTREGSFEAGVDGAEAGILMPADPAPGMQFRQEYYKGHAEDNGTVIAEGEMAQAPAGHYRDVLVIKDTSTLEPRVAEYKFYAPGVGPVLVLGVSGGAGREELLRMDRAPRSAGRGPLGRPNL